MVSVDEIDEDLKDEVASECGKFGTVVNVVIHKQTQGEGIDAEEIVKIFVRFKSSSGNPLWSSSIVDMIERSLLFPIWSLQKQTLP